MTLGLAKPSDLKPEARPYQPHGSAKQLFYCRAEEVLVSGPAGTGKSRSCLEKLHYLAETYPGMRGLIVRKTRASLTESALVTFEDKVVPPSHSILNGAQRRIKQAYLYPNGSTLVVGGLDNATKILSTDYDIAFVQEGIEIDEEAWETLTTRLRHGVLPFQQLIADTNPSTPSHWLKRRCDAGKTLLIQSRHEDNPLLWDHIKQDWTDAGRGYLAKLDALTGPRKERLRYGRWVQAEGVVYEAWEAAIHLIDRFPIPSHWRRFWSVDFGFTNPFVCQFWAMDGDGRLFLYREIYHTQRLVEDHARRMLELMQEDRKPEAIICDTDEEDRATLNKYLGITTHAAIKDVSPGIQAVASRLRKAGDGRPRAFILRDSVDQRDPALAEAKKPTCTAEEFDGYVWNLKANRKKGEEPLKENDHGMDGARYLIYWVDKYAGQSAGEPMILGERFYMDRRVAGERPQARQPQPQGTTEKPFNLIGNSPADQW